jgi:phage baseplate assembly protein W
MATFSTFPYATLANIQSSSWELMLDSTAGGGAGSGIGQVTQALADVHQTLKIIFSTIPGEDPFRPTFGCDLTTWLDKPITVAAPAVVAAVTAAIQAWEPRISVVSVTAALNPNVIGQLVVTIVWQPNLGLLSQPNTAIGTRTTIIAVGGVPSL